MKQAPDPVAQRVFLDQLCTLFREAAAIYKDYLEAESTYFHACRLRDINARQVNLLQENRTLLPDNFQEGIDALLHHFSVWRSKWDILDATVIHAPGDKFVFANEVRFPREAAQQLEALRTSLR